MNWLITGGCGFIGKNLINKIIKSKKVNSIKVLDNYSSGSIDQIKKFIYTNTLLSKPNNFFDKIQFIEGDISDYKLAKKIIKKIDIVVHLAANTGVQDSILDPIKDCEKNIIGTLNYLKASTDANVKKFIFASSSAVVGEQKPPIHEKMRVNPISPYGVSKLAGESYSTSFFNTYKLETISLRFGNVYGPGSENKTSVIAKFIKEIINNKELEVYGDGNQTRDFIFVDDLVDAIIASTIKAKLGGEIFQIANSYEVKINTIIGIISKYFEENKGKSIKVKYINKKIGDIQKIYTDNSKAKRYLDWSPKISLEEGIEKTIEYLIINQNK